VVTLNALGIHLLVELRECNHDTLMDIEKIKDFMIAAAKEAKATIVDVSWNPFNPIGFSGVVIIAESHLTIHTWPEYDYAAIDVFTCGDVIKPEVAAEYLIKQFGCKNPSIVEMKRGTSIEKRPHKITPENGVEEGSPS
jgi:S-adenosylmethionine decarboxylase